jgi:hypothetical protein
VVAVDIVTVEGMREQLQVRQAIDQADRIAAAGWDGDTDTVHALVAGMDETALRLIVTVLATTSPPVADRAEMLNRRIQAVRKTEEQERRARRDRIAVQRVAAEEKARAS